MNGCCYTCRVARKPFPAGFWRCVNWCPRSSAIHGSWDPQLGRGSCFWSVGQVRCRRAFKRAASKDVGVGWGDSVATFSPVRCLAVVGVTFCGRSADQWRRLCPAGGWRGCWWRLLRQMAAKVKAVRIRANTVHPMRSVLRGLVGGAVPALLVFVMMGRLRCSGSATKCLLLERLRTLRWVLRGESCDTLLTLTTILLCMSPLVGDIVLQHASTCTLRSLWLTEW